MVLLPPSGRGWNYTLSALCTVGSTPTAFNAEPHISISPHKCMLCKCFMNTQEDFSNLKKSRIFHCVTGEVPVKCDPSSAEDADGRRRSFFPGSYEFCTRLSGQQLFSYHHFISNVSGSLSLAHTHSSHSKKKELNAS